MLSSTRLSKLNASECSSPAPRLQSSGATAATTAFVYSRSNTSLKTECDINSFKKASTPSLVYRTCPVQTSVIFTFRWAPISFIIACTWRALRANMRPGASIEVPSAIGMAVPSRSRKWSLRASLVKYRIPLSTTPVFRVIANAVSVAVFTYLSSISSRRSHSPGRSLATRVARAVMAFALPSFLHLSMYALLSRSAVASYGRLKPV